jgi:uncharacterized protein YggE
MKAGVAKKDIQTRQLDIQPVYAPKSQTITGYQVTNTVRATMRALSSAGAAIDAAARAAGNAVRVEQLTFSIGDQSKLLAAARVQAVQQAKAQAAAMAAAAGAKLDQVRTLAEVTDSYNSQDYPKASFNASSASVPIEAGTQTLTVSVDVTYNIG